MKKIYFKREFTKEQVLSIYNSVSQEQDFLSPHRYLTNELHMVGTISSDSDTHISGFTINPGDVVVDLGTAEGSFALSIIDVASKVYLFECDPEWIRALEATFRDYNDKIIIVSRYVSDNDDESSISLDSYFNSNSIVNFIKADIEGFEWKALQGMKNILKRNTDIRAAICTYHNSTDAENFRGFFNRIDFNIDFSPGYLLIDNGYPYL